MSKPHVYLYDTVTGRPLVVDSETGQEADLGVEGLEGLLQHLAGDEPLLRRFAVWCAEQVIDHAPPSARELVNGARRSLDEEVDLSAMRQSQAGAAMAAAAVGLRHGASNAAAFLATYAAADPDFLRGASTAAQMVHLHATLSGSTDDGAVVTQTQIDWLLEQV